jgi:hypothetical protein
MNDLNEFYKSLLLTANQAGLKVIPDEHSIKLLAWLMAYGGGNEEIITNQKLQTDIQYAQQRLNLFGGEKPNTELLEKAFFYFEEADKAIKQRIPVPDWAIEICEYYGLRKPQ